jgi:hypothetical protein
MKTRGNAWTELSPFAGIMALRIVVGVDGEVCSEMRL